MGMFITDLLGIAMLAYILYLLLAFHADPAEKIMRTKITRKTEPSWLELWKDVDPH